MYVEQEDWESAAVGAGNLSELELALGDVRSAVADAEQAVSHADRSGNAFQRTGKRSSLADALHQAGRRDETRALFRAAETIQAENRPEYPLLYALPGFRYCDFLLSHSERVAWQHMITSSLPADEQALITDNNTTECREVEDRARRTLRWATDNRLSILSIALDHLSLGRSLLYRYVVEAREPGINALGSRPLGDTSEAQSHLSAAVDGLRRASYMDELSRGLLSRAWLRSVQGDKDGACVDLDEAWEIAERGPMRLHMADTHLYRARLFHAAKPYPWDSPHADLAAARKLIEECGYWRRKEELEDAEAASEHW
jgi:tetratricopeptide (TPR) repeat protein